MSPAAPVTEHHRDRRASLVLAAASATLVLGAVITCAWLCDDAYITLRTIDNLWNGYGLRWNVAERVQAFTHPLWLVVVATVYAAWPSSDGSLLLASIVTSAVFLTVFFRWAAGAGARMVVVSTVVLLSSRAFLDFSTSGLENPLTHLLIVVTWMLRSRAATSSRRLAALCGVSSLLLLTRLDLLTLVGPLLIVATHGVPARVRARAFALGATPLATWEALSLVYYGSLVPNTASAKLETGVRLTWYIEQGARYLVESFVSDPTTLIVIVVAVCVAARDRGLRPASIGLGLALAWTVRVGGDFMSGRFLTPAFVLALCVLITPGAIRRRSVTVAIGIVAAATLTLRVTGVDTRRLIATDVEYHGIVDERAAYAPHTSLAAVVARGERRPHPWEIEGRAARARQTRLVVRAAVGFFGYGAGPAVHILDPVGLADPLLARLPAAGSTRIGHFHRVVPAGYEESLPDGPNRIADRALARYYDDVRLITRGPLWTVERWAAIARWHLYGPPRRAVPGG